MGGVVNSLFGGGSMPSIEVEDPVTPPVQTSPEEPVSAAVRKQEQQRIRARRAFAGTLLAGKADGGKSTSSLL